MKEMKKIINFPIMSSLIKRKLIEQNELLEQLRLKRMYRDGKNKGFFLGCLFSGIFYLASAMLRHYFIK